LREERKSRFCRSFPIDPVGCGRLSANLFPVKPTLTGKAPQNFKRSALDRRQSLDIVRNSIVHEVCALAI
jgi:hypothetical protein